MSGASAPIAIGGAVRDDELPLVNGPTEIDRRDAEVFKHVWEDTRVAVRSIMIVYAAVFEAALLIASLSVLASGDGLVIHECRSTDEDMRGTAPLGWLKRFAATLAVDLVFLPIRFCMRRSDGVAGNLKQAGRLIPNECSGTRIQCLCVLLLFLFLVSLGDTPRILVDSGSCSFLAVRTARHPNLRVMLLH